MYLIDKRTKQYFTISKYHEGFLLALINKIDLTQQFNNWLYNGLDKFECVELANMIKTSLDSNKIYQSLEVKNPSPILVENNTTQLKGCQCLGMELFVFINAFIKFLNFARFGFYTEL